MGWLESRAALSSVARARRTSSLLRGSLLRGSLPGGGAAVLWPCETAGIASESRRRPEKVRTRISLESIRRSCSQLDFLLIRRADFATDAEIELGRP